MIGVRTQIPHGSGCGYDGSGGDLAIFAYGGDGDGGGVGAVEFETGGFVIVRVLNGLEVGDGGGGFDEGGEIYGGFGDFGEAFEDHLVFLVLQKSIVLVVMSTDEL
jgi:hypothetical protein